MRKWGKRLLAVVMAAAMTLSGQPVSIGAEETNSPTTGTGADVTISGFGSSSTGTVTLDGDFSLTYTFKNQTTNTTQDWCNYVVKLFSNGKKDIFVRADNYAWIDQATSNDHVASGQSLSDTDWTAWRSAMSTGTDCTVTIKRQGSTFLVEKTVDGKTLYTFIEASEYTNGSVTATLTGESCLLSNVQYSYTTSPLSVVTSTTADESITTAGTANDATIAGYLSSKTGNLSLSGDFDLTYTFKNTSTSTNNWNNYIINIMDQSKHELNVRADNYALMSGTVGSQFGAAPTDWSAWLSAMQAGTDMSVSLSRRGSFIDITSVCANHTMTCCGYISGDTLDIALSGERCTVSDVKYSYTQKQKSSITNFQGGALRMDTPADSSKANLRFGHKIAVPKSASNASWSWKWGLTEELEKGTVEGKKSIQNDDGTLTSNLLITNIPKTAYEQKIYSQLTVTYTLDGKTVTAADNIQFRSVKEVAETIAADNNASQDQKDYANSLLSD